MTSLNRKLSLDEVLDEFFFSVDKPSPAMLLRACEAYPEYRQDIVEFAALWSSYETSPEPTAEMLGEVSEESASRLQSFVLNLLHEQIEKSVSDTDVDTARVAVESLAGGKLKRAAAAAGLGESTLLLQKVLTKRINNIPSQVLNGLAQHLSVLPKSLEQSLGMRLAGSRSFKASDKPNEPRIETWESAVRSLPVGEREKKRLLALQGKEDFP